jgi:hypothetical protein
MLEFFADGAHWTRGGCHDGHGRRCLAGAVHYQTRLGSSREAACHDGGSQVRNGGEYARR